MFEFSWLPKAITVVSCLALGLLALPNCALSQEVQPFPNIQDHDIEIVESPFSQPQALSTSPLAWPGNLGLSAVSSAGFARIPYVGGVPYVGTVPYVGGMPHLGIPYAGVPRIPSISIPYVGGLGGLGSIGSLIGRRNTWGSPWSDPYRIDPYRIGRGASSFGNYGGYGTGLGYGLGTGFGSSYPSTFSWARPFGRLSSQNIIQTAPSKAAGNYYAPATVDPSAAGSYYASESQPTQKPRNQVFNENYNDYGDYGNGYRRSKAATYGNSDHTKPQRNYWGGSGSPFPQDLNSTPWSK